MLLARLLAPLLLAVAANGLNPCLTDDVCFPGSTSLSLSRCDITDEDADDLKACFDNVGRNNIGSLNLQGNDLTTLPLDLFDGFAALANLTLACNDLTLQAGFFTGTTSLESLDLSFNDITTLPPGAFDGLASLGTLNLEFNDIATLPPGSFEGLGSLRELYLNFNDIEMLQSGSFVGLSSLHTLDLAVNGIDVLPSGAFGGLPSLRELFLDGNPLGALAGGQFKDETSLEILTMQGIGSDTLAAGVFVGLESLIELDLSENDFATFPDGVFDGLPSLLKLDLSSTSLSEFPASVFGSVPSLQELDLADNDLAVLPAGLFDGLASLQYLSLGRNDLAVLAAGTFEGTPALEYLDLNNNRLSELPAGTFDGIDGSLVELDLLNQSPGISVMPANIFKDFPSLQVLNLRLNSINLVPGVFSGASSLTELNLDGNSLETLPSGVFEGATSLRILNLSTNDLALLQAGAFSGASSLETLLLDHAGLETLESGTFEGLMSLTTLSFYGNALRDLPPGVVGDLAALTSLRLDSNRLRALEEDIFGGTPALEFLDLDGNRFNAVPSNTFAGISSSLVVLDLSMNEITALPANVFNGMASLRELDLHSNAIASVADGVFNESTALLDLNLGGNDISSLQVEVFDGLQSLQHLDLRSNGLSTLPAELFDELEPLQSLCLDSNDLTTLPAGLFDGLDSLQELHLERNDYLQCLPATDADNVELPHYFDEDSTCACPAEPVCNDDGVLCECQSGINGYSCVGSSSELTRAFSCQSSDECTSDEQCADDEVCCPASRTCEPLFGGTTSACGDPHMTGFRGQKFDFTGEDGGWYALISALPSFHMNMRVTAPVPDLPEITYITGISLMAIGSDGMEHSIVISVKHPHSLESSCPSGMSTCLAEGALNVVIDGDIVLATPGTATAGLGVEVSAVNLPGACRSFGFEKYWERKMLEKLRVGQGELFEPKSMAEFVADVPPSPSSQAMSEWILGDPTATNMMECAAYVAESMHTDGGVFAHQSEHASFKISTPSATVRVSHGRLHQIAMRDPSGRFDLPDHLTWQMNMAVDLNEISRLSTGVLGETFVPTVDADGNAIMNGMKAIRGTQESYRVAGPFDVAFAGSTIQA